MNILFIGAIDASGGYLATWRIVVFTVLFFLWAWVGQWMDTDTAIVHTKRSFWNSLYVGAGVGALLLWFLLPTDIFAVQLLFFLVIWLTITIVYVLHRNARVSKQERILTPEHLRFVFSREEQRQASKLRLVFISANNNELPLPRRDEGEYMGYVVAEELIHDIWLRRASRAKFVVRGENYVSQYVIDGVATKGNEQPREEGESAINYLKAVAGLDVKDRRRPQAGRFWIITEGGNKAELRLGTAGSTLGEQMTVDRIEEAQTLKLDALGFNSDQLAQMKQIIQGDPGLVLVSGPAGSGVTTSLYGIVRHHDAFIQNINSVETEALYEIDNITQNIVQKSNDPKGAARQLQSVLRSDPDVVMAGFCDSKDMAQVATQAVLGGKRIYVAMAAANIFECIRAWLEMANNSERAAKTLAAVTCQRLVRILCPECRQAYTPDAALLKRLNLPAAKIRQFYRPPTEFEYDKRGKPILCPHCQGTGYYGRTAVFETLFITDVLRDLIRKNAPVNTLRAQARKDRMLYLQEQALRKVIEGTTSIQEVLRVTVEKKQERKPEKKRE